jgi:DNA-binding transcriptional regulator LsrR (DeoR family)
MNIESWGASMVPVSSSPSDYDSDQLRLMSKIARMYHERGMRQPQIAADLHISQSRISRLLRQAGELGIVRTVVTLPDGVHTDVEEALAQRYGLLDVAVVDADDGGSGDVIPALGATAATYLSETLGNGDVVGISSWSATLLATAEKMRPKNGATVEQVIQLVGGIGDPRVQVKANRLLDRFSTVTGAQPVFMPAPGLVDDPAARRALLLDPSVRPALEAWQRLTVALVGIGSLTPSPLLRSSGNATDPEQQDDLRRLGAVGDVCLRFFDEGGRLVDSEFNDHVLGITPDSLRQVPRRIAVAGGPEKTVPVRAALQGGWVNIVITDLETARRLLEG